MPQAPNAAARPAALNALDSWRLARQAWEAARRRPLLTSVLVATAKGVGADAITQLVVEGRALRSDGQATGERSRAGRCDGGAARHGAYDWRRTAALATFSGLYCGCFFHWMYSVLFPRIWPVVAVAQRRPPWRVVLSQVCLDNGFFSPCLYLPFFYVTDGAVCRSEWPAASLSRYASEFKEVFGTLLSVWVPAGLVNFTFMPVWFRASFNSMVSFAYLVVLSAQAQHFREQQCA